MVSTDFLSTTAVSIFDYDAGMSIHGSGGREQTPRFKLVSWYDNEWLFERRVDCSSI